MKDGRPSAKLRKTEQVKLWKSLRFVSTGRHDSIRWTVSAGKARHQQHLHLVSFASKVSFVNNIATPKGGTHVMPSLKPNIFAFFFGDLFVRSSMWLINSSRCAEKKGTIGSTQLQVSALCDISRLSLQR